MHLKSLLAVAALAAASLAAHADSFTQNVALVPDTNVPGAGSAGWGVTHLEAGAFMDTFTFTGLSDGLFSGSLVTIGFMNTQNIDFSSVSINGQSYTLASNGAGVDWASIGPVNVSGPLVLTVEGVAGPGLSAGTPLAASYGGTANLAPVPEPETFAMMFAGLGIVGLLARRRMGS